MLLHKAMQDLLPLLKKGFDELWQEIYVLATTRILGYIPLKRVGSVWNDSMIQITHIKSQPEEAF
jgi:hypothetical protein